MGLLLLLPFFREIPVFHANIVDPDKTSHSEVSNLGLHCLPLSLFCDARAKLVKKRIGLQKSKTEVTKVVSLTNNGDQISKVYSFLSSLYPC